ncbi:hypothetical protein RIF25_14945 [Thermosynechococcaceae cyanobacterium BACA0444]|uniref:Uncharacterized protein n=1 Tax=Pseudocalidococcus azoricus BACA0444 TaxID=2918990 RepID=A0AAE4FTM0_9CYAN|nr:hypothetical protein [Pseudocalidococcus azoricus]MDS3862098.1 hypothetical protein [Pseudocalidococcus azoricus BACA0444]
MDIYRPESAPSTPEMMAELKRLQTLIESAIADGYLSADEMARIKQQIAADGQVTFQELELYRQLVLDKITQGELARDFQP